MLLIIVLLSLLRFNSTLVQLKVLIFLIVLNLNMCFNSTLVQLKGDFAYPYLLLDQ